MNSGTGDQCTEGTVQKGSPSVGVVHRGA